MQLDSTSATRKEPYEELGESLSPVGLQTSSLWSAGSERPAHGAFPFSPPRHEFVTELSTFASTPSAVQRPPKGRKIDAIDESQGPHDHGAMSSSDRGAGHLSSIFAQRPTPGPPRVQAQPSTARQLSSIFATEPIEPTIGHGVFVDPPQVPPSSRGVAWTVDIEPRAQHHGAIVPSGRDQTRKRAASPDGIPRPLPQQHPPSPTSGMPPAVPILNSTGSHFSTHGRDGGDDGRLGLSSPPPQIAVPFPQPQRQHLPRDTFGRGVFRSDVKEQGWSHLKGTVPDVMPVSTAHVSFPDDADVSSLLLQAERAASFAEAALDAAARAGRPEHAQAASLKVTHAVPMAGATLDAVAARACYQSNVQTLSRGRSGEGQHRRCGHQKSAKPYFVDPPYVPGTCTHHGRLGPIETQRRRSVPSAGSLPRCGPVASHSPDSSPRSSPRLPNASRKHEPNCRDPDVARFGGELQSSPRWVAAESQSLPPRGDPPIGYDPRNPNFHVSALSYTGFAAGYQPPKHPPTLLERERARTPPRPYDCYKGFKPTPLKKSASEFSLSPSHTAAISPGSQSLSPLQKGVATLRSDDRRRCEEREARFAKVREAEAKLADRHPRLKQLDACRKARSSRSPARDRAKQGVDTQSSRSPSTAVGADLVGAGTSRWPATTVFTQCVDVHSSRSPARSAGTHSVDARETRVRFLTRPARSPVGSSKANNATREVEALKVAALPQAPAAGKPKEYVGFRNKDGKREGYGVMRGKDGSVYSGQWVAGQRQGYGTLFFDGGVFEGEWQHGAADGIGNVKFKNGDSFSGAYVNSQKSGLGTYRWSDGAEESGSYVEGRKNGWHQWRKNSETWSVRYDAGKVVEAKRDDTAVNKDIESKALSQAKGHGKESAAKGSARLAGTENPKHSHTPSPAPSAKSIRREHHTVVFPDHDHPSGTVSTPQPQVAGSSRKGRVTPPQAAASAHSVTPKGTPALASAPSLAPRPKTTHREQPGVDAPEYDDITTGMSAARPDMVGNGNNDFGTSSGGKATPPHSAPAQALTPPKATAPAAVRSRRESAIIQEAKAWAAEIERVGDEIL